MIKAGRLRPAPNPAASKTDRCTQAPRGLEPEEIEIWLSSKYASRLQEFGNPQVSHISHFVF